MLNMKLGLIEMRRDENNELISLFLYITCESYIVLKTVLAAFGFMTVFPSSMIFLY